MSRDPRVLVVMLANYGPFTPGERAGYAPHIAQKLVAKGIARWPDDKAPEGVEATPAAETKSVVAPPVDRAMRAAPEQRAAPAEDHDVPEGLDALREALDGDEYRKVLSLVAALLPDDESTPRTKKDLYARAERLLAEGGD